MKRLLAIIVVILLGITIAIFLTVNKDVKQAGAGTIVRRVDVLGSGTSTAGTYNFNAHATTSATIIVGGQTDIVDLYVFPESASSTAHLSVQFFGSSHSRCGATGAVGQGSFHDYLSKNAVSGEVTTINPATSTVSWTTPTQGKVYRLTDVNVDCLKVFVGGTAVNVYMQAVLKTLSF